MSTWSDYESLIINGKQYALRDLKASDFHDFAQDVVGFVEEWSNQENHLFFSTSGSTGQPKRIKFHKNECHSSAIQTIEHFDLKAQDSVLLCLPIQFVAAKMMVIRAIVGGLNLILESPKGNPNISTKCLQFAALTPMQVMNVIDRDEAALDRIEKLIIGGGRISESLMKKLESRETAIYETYGMTETLTHVAVRQLAPTRERTFKALKNIRMEKGSKGELILHVPYLLDSPIITQDLVEIETDNEMLWIGRMDDVVNSGGIKIQLNELEREIERFCEFPFICVGIDDDSLGERLVMIIESIEMESVSLQKINKAIKENLTNHYRPKQIFIVNELKRTKSGKLSRKLNKSLILGRQNSLRL